MDETKIYRNYYGKIPGNMQSMEGYILIYARIKTEKIL